MKKLFQLLFLFSFLSLSAQQTQEVYPTPKYPELFKTLGAPIMPDDPDWVREMYSATPNFYKIVRMHDAYYKTHLLKKTTHTQNYKHFYRIVSQNHYYNDQGDIVIEDISQLKDNEPFRVAPTNRIVSSNPEWTPVAPLETFSANGNRQSSHVNVYSIAQSVSNPNIMYCGTETQAVFKSTDGGDNWTEVGKYDFHGGTAQAIKIDPKDENTVYVAYDKKFFRTTDGGQTWTLLIHDKKWKMDVEVHPTEDIVYLAGDCGLLRSTDKGNTWTTIIPIGANDDGRCSDIEFKADDPNTVYVAKANASVNRFEIWKSTDNGLTFLPKTTGWYQPTNPNRTFNMGIGGAQGAKIANTKADPNRLYVLLLGSDVSYAEDINFIGVFRSDDAGETWTLPYDGNNDGQPDNNYGGPYSAEHWSMSSFNVYGGNYDQGWYNADIDASDTNPDVFLVGMLNLFKSENGGKSYLRYGGYRYEDLPRDGRYRHPDIQDILVQDNNVWVASDGGVDKYDANLSFVDSKNKGITTCDLWGFDQGWNEDVLVGGRYHDGDMAYHENYTNGRTLALGGGESRTGYVNLGENRKVYHDDIGGRIIPETLPGVIQGTDNLSKYPNTSGSITTSEIVNDPRYWNHIFMGKDNKLWESWDYGKNFTLRHTFGSAGNTVRGIEISRQNPLLMFVVHHLGSHVKLWKTTDAGQSWTEVALPYYNWAYTMSLNEKDELYIAYDNNNNTHKVYKSTDLGASWTNITTPLLSGNRFLDIEVQGGTDGGVYAMTSNKVFYRNNTMDWVDYSEGIPTNFRLLNAKPFYKKSKLRLAGSRGVWERDFYEPSAPVAQLMIGQRESFCDREEIQFEDYSMLNHTDATWQWDFPGASYVSSNTVRNPLVSYSTPGTYNVTLSVTQGGKTSTKTVQNIITVNESTCSPSDFAEKTINFNQSNNQYLTTKFDTPKSVANFTFTGWIKPDGVQPNYSSVFYVKGKNNVISLDFKNNRNELGTHSGGRWWFDSGLIVPKNKWSYVALVYTPNKVTIILNESVYEMTGSFAPVDIDNIDFGIHNRRGDRRYKGALEEVTLWERALSIDEIRLQRHLTKKNYKDPAMFAYYQFNDILGGSVYALVGNNDLAVVGAVDLINSTCPVGPGVSQKKTMTNNDLTTFDIPKVNIATLNRPFNGDVVISRLKVRPFEEPTESYKINDEYYIINNYGKNKIIGEVAVLEFTDIEGVANLNKSELNLYDRERNSDENNWVNQNAPISISGKSVRYENLSLKTVTPATVNATKSWQSSAQWYFKTTQSVTTNVDEVENNTISLYPNPLNVNSEFSFRGITDNSILRIYAPNGKQFMVQVISENQKIKSPAVAGVYIYSIETENKLQTGKMIVQ